MIKNTTEIIDSEENRKLQIRAQVCPIWDILDNSVKKQLAEHLSINVVSLRHIFYGNRPVGALNARKIEEFLRDAHRISLPREWLRPDVFGR